MLAIVCIVASACAAARSSDPGAPGTPSPPGKLVDIGSFRLHLHCTGRGSPTAVLLPGSGDFSFDWSLVQTALQTSMRVCSFDRAGSAWSDLGPVPRTLRQEAYELDALLRAAGIQPPFVLVGHSLGGLVARVFAETHPTKVAGMVLVDATHENTQLMMQGKVVRVREMARGRPVPSVQTMRSSPPMPATAEDLKQEQMNREVFGPPRISPPFDRLPEQAQAWRLWALNHPKLSAETDDFFAEELQAMHIARTGNPHPFGAIPLIVLAGGRTDSVPPPGVTAEAWKLLNAEKRAQKADIATLSTQGKLIVDPTSGHHIQLDNPALVAQAVREIAAAGVRATNLRQP